MPTDPMAAIRAALEACGDDTADTPDLRDALVTALSREAHRKPGRDDVFDPIAKANPESVNDLIDLVRGMPARSHGGKKSTSDDVKLSTPRQEHTIEPDWPLLDARGRVIQPSPSRRRTMPKDMPMPPESAPGSEPKPGKLGKGDLAKILGPKFSEAASAADDLLGTEGGAGMEPPAGETAASAEPGGEAAPGGEPDLAPMVEMLGISEAKAKSYWKAAQSIPMLKGKDPAALASEIEGDMNLRLRLESAMSSEEPEMGMPEGGGMAPSPDMPETME